jgi:hypothetical protein
MILREFGRLPLFFHWWSKVLKFMKRVYKMDEACLVKQALLQEVQLVKDGKKCWLGNVMQFLRSLYPSQMPQRVDDRLRWIFDLHITKVKKDLVKLWKGMWGDIAAGEISGSKLLFYHTVMASDDTNTKYGWFAPAKHMRVAMAHDIHSNLVRFRLGNHSLLSEQRRWFKASVHELARFSCRLCALNVAEDEAHVLLHCPYYEYVRLEDQFADLLPDQTDLRTLFASPYQIVLARFISHMVACRTEAGKGW